MRVESHNSLQTYLRCPRAYRLKYLDGARATQIIDPALVIGKAFHEWLEKTWWATNPSDCPNTLAGVPKDKLELMKAAYVTAYMSNDMYSFYDVSCEKQLEDQELEISGRVDALATVVFNNEYVPVVMEHKTTSQPLTEDYFTQCFWSLQPAMYCLLAKLNVVIWDAVRVPSSSNPNAGGAIVARQKFTYTQKYLDTVKEEIQTIQRLIELEVFPRNTGSCGSQYRSCEMKTACYIDQGRKS
jgi:hypothetical protein